VYLRAFLARHEPITPSHTDRRTVIVELVPSKRHRTTPRTRPRAATPSFRRAAARYLEEHLHKRSLERDARALTALDPFIGALPLHRVHHESLRPYVRWRLEQGHSPGTINRELAVARRILNLAARLWRDARDRPWLA
jgi:hypothetical protein